MSNRRVNEIDNYFRVKIESASPMTLIHMVYDRAIKTLNDAKVFIEGRDRDKFGEAVMHAQDCIRELRTSLNLELGEVPKNLYKLYDFMINQLVESAITRENPLTYVNRVLKMLVDLQNTWRQAEKNLQNQKQVERPAASEYKSFSLVG